MIRIIAGIHKGRRLLTPEGRETRPTSDRARTGLFNILGPWIVGRRVLDLYAGCGCIGFESLSRGAAHVMFVERESRSLSCINENMRQLDETEHVDVVGGDVNQVLARLAIPPFDVVFADPPYREADVPALLATVAACRSCGPDTVLIVEHATTRGMLGTGQAGWECYRTAQYGKTQFSFFSRTEPTGDLS